MENTITKSWHIGTWPVLAWAETLVKSVALIIGCIVLINVVTANRWMWPSGTGLIQVIVQLILVLGLVVAIFDRFIEREIISMIFVIPNNIAHWGILLALLSVSKPNTLVTTFFVLMLIGDLIKLIFLKVHNFTVRDTPRSVLYGLTLIYVVGYTINLILQLS